MAPTPETNRAQAADAEFEALVTAHYQSLYRFAFTLTRSEADACDLTQQTFLVWGDKGHQLRDRSRAKSWLFTTLYREFLRHRRHQVRFPEVELTEAESHAGSHGLAGLDILKLDDVLRALAQVEPAFQAALSLYYVEELSYREMSEILGIPIGTVQSRLSRGKEQIRKLLARDPAASARMAR